jgi:hypothetical protein
MASEFRSLVSGNPRPATWAERDREALLRNQGIADVYVQPEEAPQEFWQAVVVAIHFRVLTEAPYDQDKWDKWAREYRWATGLPNFDCSVSKAFTRIVQEGMYSTRPGYGHVVGLGERLAAVEHLLDVVDEYGNSLDIREFEKLINEKCRTLRVGLVISGHRFAPLSSEHLHQEIVQPTLLLLASPDLADVDDLYRKAFSRQLASDHAGAITAASSAVEEMLRVGLGRTGGRLQPLLQQARTQDWIIPAVEQMAVRLDALRSESDAHTPGTDDERVSMFAIHIAGSILLHLAARRTDFTQGRVST